MITRLRKCGRIFRGKSHQWAVRVCGTGRGGDGEPLDKGGVFEMGYL